MSHCAACDKLLTDEEAKRKSRITHEEIGLCDRCLSITEEAYGKLPITTPSDFDLPDDVVEVLERFSVDDGDLDFEED